MKKLLLVILPISSLLLTQCYTQNEFLTNDYDLLTEIEEVEKIKLYDNTEHSMTRKDSYIIESDSLIVITYLEPTTKNSKYSSYVVAYDTIKISAVQSYFTSEVNAELTLLTIVLGSAALILLAALWTVNTHGIF